MHLLKKVIPLMFLGLMLIGLSTPVQAEFNPFGDFKYPEVKPPDWEVGQSVSYAIKVSGIPDMDQPFSCDLRMALVGKETIEGNDFYWVELDVSNLNGLPPEAAGMVQSLKVKLLSRMVEDPTKFQQDPKAAMKEFAEGKLIQKVVFQLNSDEPQVIDFMAMEGLSQMMTGMDFDTMVDEIPMDEMEEEAPDVKFDCGTKSVTVAGKVYPNATYCTFEGGEEGGYAKGTTYADDSIPVSAFLKFVMNIKDTEEGMDMDINVDMTGFKTSGATSEITGTPVPFDFGAMMGGMMGGEMPPMGME